MDSEASQDDIEIVIPMPQDIPQERRKTTPIQFVIPTTEIDFGFNEPEEEDQKDTIKDLKR